MRSKKSMILGLGLVLVIALAWHGDLSDVHLIGKDDVAFQRPAKAEKGNRLLDWIWPKRRKRLTENSLGNVVLDRSRKVTIQNLADNFPGTTVIEGVSEDARGQYAFYSVVDDGRESVFIRLRGGKRRFPTLVYVYDEEAVDRYGAHPGMTFSKLSKRRKNMKVISRDEGVFATYPGSRVFYLLDMEPVSSEDRLEGDPEAKVIALMWTGRK